MISRREALLGDWLQSWLRDSERALSQSELLENACEIQKRLKADPIDIVAHESRLLCDHRGGPIFNAYGGYYFSPLQALWLDALRSTLPSEGDARSVALAALISAASRCAASPGHTAQPFKANETAGIYLREAWRRDVKTILIQVAALIAPQFARKNGNAMKVDALELAEQLREGDVAFIDPPYSGVHYSRFYHVLETLADFKHIKVAGSGRYPPPSLRPRSDYSIQTAAKDALSELLRKISKAGSSAIITFPSGHTSNGLSGDKVREVAEEFFCIAASTVSTKFSTLGGNLRHRDARQTAEELILTLTPRG